MECPVIDAKVCVTWDENDSGTGGTGTDEIYVSCSNDGGMSFPTTTRVTDENNPPINLGNTAQSTNPDIAVANGEIYVTWEDQITGTTEIYFSKSTDMGVTFSPAVSISNNDGNASIEPEIVVADNGNIVIVWEDFDNNQDILTSFSDDGGLTFSSPNDLSNNSGESQSPVIDVSGNTVVIAWEDKTPNNFDIFTVTSTDGGENFSASADGPNLSDDSGNEDLHPEIAISRTNIVIVWDKAGGDIFAEISTDSGANFIGTPINISGTSAESLNAHVEISGTNIVIVWEDKSGLGSEFDVFSWVRDVSGGTTITTNLSSDSDKSDQSELVVLGNNVIVVWQNEVPAGLDLFKRTSFNNGDTFDTADNISNTGGVQSFDGNNIENGQAMVAVGNSIFITWEDNELGQDETYFNKSIDGGDTFFFADPLNLSLGIGDASQHQSIGAQ